MHKLERLLVFLLPPLVCAGVAVGLGQDANWDFRNYHYYNAYAFLTGRQALDVAPGQLQTFFNPLLDLPFFWLAQVWPPKGVLAVLGAVHGLNLSLLWLIFHQVTQWSQARWRWVVGAGLLLLSLSGPGFYSELGNTMNDNLISLFILLPLWLLLRAAGGTGRPAMSQVALAGLVMGAGVGLKPTIIFYAVSAGLALLVLWPTAPRRWQAFLLYGLAGVAGTLGSAGFWWWEMWGRYGNPLFPYFNHIFQSPYVQAWAYTDTRFLPHAWWEYVTWPLLFSANGQRVAEPPFRDIRFGLLYGVGLLWLGQTVVARFWPPRPTPARPGLRWHAPSLRFLAIFAGLSFGLWVGLFSIYRYLIPLELLAPLLLGAALAHLAWPTWARVSLGLSLVLALGLAYQPLNWGRTEWPGAYVEVRNLPELALTDRSVVLLVGTGPLSYVIPAFPPTVRFVRPEGNLYLEPHHRFYQQVAATLAQADKVYLLFERDDPGMNLAMTLTIWGLNWPEPDCFRLDTNVPDNLVICRAGGE